jgi:hypothetical protein
MTIMVRYSCPACGLKDVQVDVPARGEEDVIAWMDQTFHAIGADHRQRSPNCRPERLVDVKVPMAGADRIGGPSVH